jgi:hypothetical protein
VGADPRPSARGSGDGGAADEPVSAVRGPAWPGAGGGCRVASGGDVRRALRCGRRCSGRRWGFAVDAEPLHDTVREAAGGVRVGCAGG